MTAFPHAALPDETSHPPARQSHRAVRSGGAAALLLFAKSRACEYNDPAVTRMRRLGTEAGR